MYRLYLEYVLLVKVIGRAELLHMMSLFLYEVSYQQRYRLFGRMKSQISLSSQECNEIFFIYVPISRGLLAFLVKFLLRHNNDNSEYGACLIAPKIWLDTIRVLIVRQDNKLLSLVPFATESVHKLHTHKKPLFVLNLGSQIGMLVRCCLYQGPQNFVSYFFSKNRFGPSQVPICA